METDRTLAYDDAGKLLSVTETEAGCGTCVYTYEYDLMGNRTAAVKTNTAGTVVENRKYVYNESNQLAEAVLCDGRTTRKVQYTYDADGNLTGEYSPTDRSLTTYTYTVENRLEAVYTGTAYSQTLQMAAAYDGDGNRVYQMNYNPDKDEDFSDYYCTYNSCDYKGTGIRLRAEGEVSSVERELLSLITASGAITDSSYELIEYINDVKREYAEVLVEQNINGTLDTAYVYGAVIGVGSDRLSLDHFNSTGYYLYDPRGSVTGITNEEGQIYQSYRYSVFGEITFGAPQYENEYTYNGESYNPNIKSQYLRARYYCVVTADFLTEDSYLGNIAEPLTLNRYNYCVGSPLNYVDPSGNMTARHNIKDFLDSLFGNNNNDTTDDEPSVLESLAKPIPTPRPTQVPLILPEGVEPYEQGLFPCGGINYLFEALQRQPEQDISQSTDGYLNQQVENAESNNENSICEPGEIVNLREKFMELAIEDPTLGLIGEFMREYYTDDVITFLQIVADHESYGGRYDIRGGENNHYLGKYQLGDIAFRDIKFQEMQEGSSVWSETAHIYGIYSDEDYLNSPIAQEVAMVLILRRNYLYVLNNNQDEYIGQQIVWKNAMGESQEVTVTLSGLLAASHLVGNGKLNRGFSGELDWSEVVDGNKTPALVYMDTMGGLNLDILLGGIE